MATSHADRTRWDDELNPDANRRMNRVTAAAGVPIAVGAAAFLLHAFDVLTRAQAWIIAGAAFVVMIVALGITLRARALDDFVPSRARSLRDRISPGAQNIRTWLVPAPRSGVQLVSAPNADSAAVADARKRLDAALLGVSRPVKPRWFRLVERTGYGWYLVTAVPAFAITMAVRSNWAAAWATALMSIPLVGFPLASLLTTIAKRQALRAACRSAQPVADDVAPVIRPVQASNARAFDAAIDRDDPDEDRVAALVFRAAGTDAEADKAAADLAALARRPSHTSSTRPD